MVLIKQLKSKPMTTETLFIQRSVFVHAWQYNKNTDLLNVFLEETNILGFKTLNDVLYLHQQSDSRHVDTITVLPGEYLVKDPTGWIEIYPEEQFNNIWVKFSVFLHLPKENLLS